MDASPVIWANTRNGDPVAVVDRDHFQLRTIGKRRVCKVTASRGAHARCLAERSETRDNDDIGFLLAACGVRTIEQAQDTYERYFHQEVLSAVAVARVGHWLEVGTN